MDRAPTATDLLAVWEQGRPQSPVERALALLALARPDLPAETLAQWSIGRRDAQLLNLREQIFGPQVTAQATCPACQQLVELNFATSDVRAQPAASEPPVVTIVREGRELQFRLPNSLDVASLTAVPAPAPDQLAQTLLARCQRSPLNGPATDAMALDAELVHDVATKMSALDPQGDVQLALCCPDCGHRWRAPFDIVTFLWRELHSWATRLLHEVHVLASAYGWRESDILAMTAPRRRAYLEIIGA